MGILYSVCPRNSEIYRNFDDDYSRFISDAVINPRLRIDFFGREDYNNSITGHDPGSTDHTKGRKSI